MTDGCKAELKFEIKDIYIANVVCFLYGFFLLWTAHTVLSSDISLHKVIAQGNVEQSFCVLLSMGACEVG